VKGYGISFFCPTPELWTKSAVEESEKKFVDVMRCTSGDRVQCTTKMPWFDGKFTFGQMMCCAKYEICVFRCV